MVVAALLRDCCYNPAGLQPKCHSNPIAKPTKTERSRRAKEWNVWTSSISGDIDLAADWWFLTDLLDTRSLSEDVYVQALLAFTIVGTVTWILEVYVTVAVERVVTSRRRIWDFVPFLVMLFEDIPQIVLTWLIAGRFTNLSGLAVFNITTSVYSLVVRLFGELFLTCNWCCEMQKDEEEEDDDEKSPLKEDVGSGSHDEEEGGASGIAYSSNVSRQK